MALTLNNFTPQLCIFVFHSFPKKLSLAQRAALQVFVTPPANSQLPMGGNKAATLDKGNKTCLLTKISQLMAHLCDTGYFPSQAVRAPWVIPMGLIGGPHGAYWRSLWGSAPPPATGLRAASLLLCSFTPLLQKSAQPRAALPFGCCWLPNGRHLNISSSRNVELGLECSIDASLTTHRHTPVFSNSHLSQLRWFRGSPVDEHAYFQLGLPSLNGQDSLAKLSKNSRNFKTEDFVEN